MFRTGRIGFANGNGVTGADDTGTTTRTNIKMLDGKVYPNTQEDFDRTEGMYEGTMQLNMDGEIY